MKAFKDFGITIHRGETFEGEKIKVTKILNKPIIVHKAKINPSKQFSGGLCGYIQIEVDGQKRVIFTGAKGLIDAVSQLTEHHFPFEATIIEENDRYEFR